MHALTPAQLLLSGPAIRLLRKKNAAAVITFLQSAYKDNTVLTEEKLAGRLAIFLENHEGESIEDEEIEPSRIADFSDKALKFIRHWTGPECRFLTDSRNEKGETEYRLTRHTMRVFQWMGDLETREFVGTRSRLEDIFRKLRDIVAHSADNRDERVRALEKQKQEIDDQIQRIQRGEDTAYDNSRIREEVQSLNEIVRSLALDFREVQENFRELAKDIRTQTIGQQTHKGETLRFALDALERLQDTDQGKSFYGFYEMLGDPRRLEALNDLVDRLYLRLEAREIPYPPDRPLENLRFDLYREAHEVYEYNRSFSERLAKVVATRNLAERKRAMHLIQEIKALAATPGTAVRAQQLRWSIDDSGADLPRSERHIPDDLLERKESTAWLPPDLRDLTGIPDLTDVFETYQIEIAELERRIDSLLRERESVSLPEVVEAFPVEKGLYEVIAYLDIATRNNHHFIDYQQYKEEFQPVCFAASPAKFLFVPRVVYHRP